MGDGRTFGMLITAVLLLGIADAMSSPYLVLFAVDHVHLSPFQAGVIASASGVGGIAVSHWVGRRFDHRPTRTYIVAVTLAGALGFAVLTVTTSFAILVLLGLTLLGAVAAAFPQLFALARVVLGDGPAGQRSAPLLRSGWSLSWALGPLLGAALLAGTGFTGVFVVTAAVLVATALVTLAIPSPATSSVTPASAPLAPATAGDPADRAAERVPAERVPTDRDPAPGDPLPLPPAVVTLLTLSIALFFTAMFAGSLALPLFVTRDLHQPVSALGWLFSACAAVEVLAALALVWIPARVSQRALITAGMALFVGYFALCLLASGMALLLAAQVARGVAIAIVGAAGIRYFQDALAPATGRATALFANASTAGLLVAGVLAGSSLQLSGYRATLLLCGVTAGIATVTFALATRVRPERVPAGV